MASPSSIGSTVMSPFIWRRSKPIRAAWWRFVTRCEDIVTSDNTTAVKPSHKVALVAGGYVSCLLVASAAIAVRVAITGGAARQAASGMYGFGDTILFVAVFGVAALVPTGMALFFLRPGRPFWNVLSASGLVLAATGIAAVILYATGRGEM